MQFVDIRVLIDSKTEWFNLGGNVKNRPPYLSTSLLWGYLRMTKLFLEHADRPVPIRTTCHWPVRLLVVPWR